MSGADDLYGITKRPEFSFNGVFTLSGCVEYNRFNDYCRTRCNNEYNDYNARNNENNDQGILDFMTYRA